MAQRKYAHQRKNSNDYKHVAYQTTRKKRSGVSRRTATRNARSAVWHQRTRVTIMAIKINENRRAYVK